MDPFIQDVTDVVEVPNVRMIDYKGKFCMVRKLQNNSSILRMNPTLKYLVRFPQGKTPDDKNLFSISYIPISEEEFNNGLAKYKKIMTAPIKGGRNTFRKSVTKNTFRKNKKQKNNLN
jgi:hypothetical protein